jgi:hypothetical protein
VILEELLDMYLTCFVLFILNQMLRAKVTGPLADLFVPEKSTVPRARPSWMAVGQEIGIGQLF